MKTKTQHVFLIAGASVGALSLLLLLGWAVAIGGSSPSSHTLPASAPALSEVTPNAVSKALAEVQSNLEQTAAHLRKVKPVNKSHVEEAQVQVAIALQRVGDAMNYALTHPELADLPAIPTDIRIPENPTKPDGTKPAINVQRALDSLRAAHESLQRTPGGDLVSYRQQIDASFKVAADDLANAINVIGGAPGAPTPRNDLP